MLRLSACLTCLLVAASPATPRPDTARSVIESALEALGGRAAIESIASLEIESIGHEYYIDQSERPEGPFVTSYVSVKERRDVAGGRSRLELQRREFQFPDWTPEPVLVADATAAMLVMGDRTMPAGRQAYEDARERIELAPERVLLAALTAEDLARGPDVVLHGIPQQVVTFSWRRRHARLLIDSFDHVPSALETTGEDPMGIWGKVRVTTYYSLWSIVPGGVRYPLQTDREWNSVLRSSSTVTKIAVNGVTDTGQFAIPDAVRQAFLASPAVVGIPALKFDPARGVELAPGVMQFSGNWNVGFVRQPDGLVVIEAPIGSGYSAGVLAEAAKRWPGVPVKAVITTSDAWPHMGGVREYVARGIAVYALDLNRPILERLLAADYTGRPDALARSPRAPRFTWVSGKTVIGSGDTRIELYPVHGENGERMLFAYLPAARLLYSSDEIMRDRTKNFFMPEYLVEVRDAVTRYGLSVERIFGMHIGPTPWTEIESAIAKASAR